MSDRVVSCLVLNIYFGSRFLVFSIEVRFRKKMIWLFDEIRRVKRINSPNYISRSCQCEVREEEPNSLFTDLKEMGWIEHYPQYPG